jgi:heme/copper-type cytochrome/quinol oxidase subunit 2
MKKLIGLVKEFSPAILVLATPVLALAQPVYNGAPDVPSGQVGSLNDILSLLCTVFMWAFYFLIVLAVIFVLIAAFKYLTAAGDPEKVKGAGNMLLYTAVAVGVALLARAIPLIVGSFLGAGTITSC